MIARSHSSGTVTQPYCCRYRSLRGCHFLCPSRLEVVISVLHLTRALNCGGCRPELFIPWTATTTPTTMMGGWSFLEIQSIGTRPPARVEMPHFDFFGGCSG